MSKAPVMDLVSNLCMTDDWNYSSCILRRTLDELWKQRDEEFLKRLLLWHQMITFNPIRDYFLLLLLYIQVFVKYIKLCSAPGLTHNLSHHEYNQVVSCHCFPINIFTSEECSFLYLHFLFFFALKCQPTLHITFFSKAKSRKYKPGNNPCILTESSSVLVWTATDGSRDSRSFFFSFVQNIVFTFFILTIFYLITHPPWSVKVRSIFNENVIEVVNKMKNICKLIQRIWILKAVFFHWLFLSEGIRDWNCSFEKHTCPPFVCHFDLFVLSSFITKGIHVKREAATHDSRVGEQEHKIPNESHGGWNE